MTQIALSATVPRPGDTFGYAYIPYIEDWDRVRPKAARRSSRKPPGAPTLGANTGQRFDLAYLSCLPWIDFTALDNALPGPDDCIPRFSWGKFVRRRTMGAGVARSPSRSIMPWSTDLQVGQFFQAAQACLDQFAATHTDIASIRSDAKTPSALKGPKPEMARLQQCRALAYFLNKRLTHLGAVHKTMLWAEAGAGLA
jgi:hypothetical protein